MADNKNKNNQVPPFNPNSINDMMKNLDLNAIQNMLSNIDMNQVAALASQMGMPTSPQQNTPAPNAKQPQIPAAFYNEPIVAVLNSIKPFIPQDRWSLVDELIKLLGIRAAITSASQQKR